MTQFYISGQTFATVILLFGAMVLNACGTETPFARGEQIVSAKPANPSAKGGSGSGKDSEPKPVSAKEFFSNYVLARIQSCHGCHSDSLQIQTYDDAKRLIVPGKPTESDLYLAATGQTVFSGFRHHKKWPEDSQEAQDLAKWIHLEGNENLIEVYLPRGERLGSNPLEIRQPFQ